MLSVLEEVMPVMSNVNVAVFKTLGSWPVIDGFALLYFPWTSPGPIINWFGLPPEKVLR